MGRWRGRERERERERGFIVKEDGVLKDLIL